MLSSAHRVKRTLGPCPDLQPSLSRSLRPHALLRYSFFLCESHDRLTGNITFQDNLLNALLSADDN